jgi:hypothetical protein
MKTWTWMVAGVAGLLLAVPAAAQKPVIYPAKGQSADQQKKDDGECYTWAKNNTGIDPAAPPPAQQTAPQGGERVRGAARGAAAGAVLGEVASGDASHGAAVGATAGVLAGGARSRQNKAAASQQAQAQQQQVMQTYYRAYGACMEGRGYTIK